MLCWMDSSLPGPVVLATSVTGAGTVDRNVRLGLWFDAITAGTEESGGTWDIATGAKVCGTRNVLNGV